MNDELRQKPEAENAALDSFNQLFEGMRFASCQIAENAALKSELVEQSKIIAALVMQSGGVIDAATWEHAMANDKRVELALEVVPETQEIIVRTILKRGMNMFTKDRSQSAE